MSGERSIWFCSKCGRYLNPQSLDYSTGECWYCQDKLCDCGTPALKDDFLCAICRGNEDVQDMMDRDMGDS